ncbi:26s proteasome non-atpase regulatory subunit 9 [Anaeramoeba flamelloides]|uniref:26s proteasome non-atpase regulatory subunit 9 n=1 Tax=Anaeramoeba flamelloides TaxID=1746091 RepID=A0ABQ8ZB49_9EUKA|nr:26s proteasome non-atpase regulatory subunit 9 [Anaeramoeba flamelloides]
MQKLKQLNEQKLKIEKRIDELVNWLDEQGVGFNGSLLDQDGFPLNKDLYKIRDCRIEVIKLGNDHKKLMCRIEERLIQWHKNGQPREKEKEKEKEIEIETVEDNEKKEEMKIQEEFKNTAPFAKVDGVLSFGPAGKAGLQNDDYIIMFGTSSSMRTISIEVNSSEGIKTDLIIKRKNQILKLSIVPKRFEGKGLLGCHIIPVSQFD